MLKPEVYYWNNQKILVVENSHNWKAEAALSESHLKVQKRNVYPKIQPDQ